MKSHKHCLVTTNIKEWEKIKGLAIENNISISSDFPKNENAIFFLFDYDRNNIRFLKSEYGFLPSIILRGIDFHLVSSENFVNYLLDMKIKSCKTKMATLTIPHDNC